MTNIQEIISNKKKELQVLEKISTFFPALKIEGSEFLTNKLINKYKKFKLYNYEFYTSLYIFYCFKCEPNRKVYLQRALYPINIINIRRDEIILPDCIFYNSYRAILDDKIMSKIKQRVIKVIKKHPNHQIVIKGKNNPFASLRAFQ